MRGDGPQEKQVPVPEDPWGLVGRILDTRYRIDAVVGEGGFGVVYRAMHLGFQAPVAIKALKVPQGLGSRDKEKFLDSFNAE